MITLVKLKMRSLLLSENFLLASENMRENESLASRVMFSKLDKSLSFRRAKWILSVDRYDWQITLCKSQFVTIFRGKVLKNSYPSKLNNNYTVVLNSAYIDKHI